MLSKAVPPEENPLGFRPIRGLVWRYAAPGILSQLVTSLNNIVDQLFIGWGIGQLGIAATNIAFPLAGLTTALAMLFGMGASARFSLLLGQKNPEEARQAAGNAMTLLLCFGSLLAAVFLLFQTPLLYLFGSTDLILPYAQAYTKVLALGLPFGIFSVGLSYLIRADGSPAYSSLLLLSGSIFNMLFDPVFLFVCHWGIQGIAWATVLGQILSAALALGYLLRKAKSLPPRRGDFRPRGSSTLPILQLGVSPFATHILMTLVQVVQMNVLRTYGALSPYGSEAAIAGAGAASKVSIVFLSAIIGIALGCQPIYGFNFGAKRYDRVKAAYLYAIRCGTAVATGAFLVMQLFPHQLAACFGSEDPQFLAFTARYFRIYLAMTFLNALQPITANFFTAMGRASLGFRMAVLRQGALLLPLLVLLPMALGVDGALYAGPISDGIAALIVMVFARRELGRLDAIAAQTAEPGDVS